MVERNKKGRTKQKAEKRDDYFQNCVLKNNRKPLHVDVTKEMVYIIIIIIIIIITIIIIIIIFMQGKKVKQSRYRPGVAQRVPGS